MAFQAALTIFFFLVTIATVKARLPIATGSSRSLVGLIDGPPKVGVCAASIAPLGYKCQDFEVTTEDGYILSLQRIPNGRFGGGQQKRQPVLIQHGVLVDGTTWFLNKPEQNLPCILADNGFDVWIANTRGTRHSRKHIKLDANHPAYWNWSWDELVAYDLPTVFNYVYNQTGGQKIHYVGHSQGTLMLLASLSEGKLVDQLNSAALLSPVAYLSHMTTPLGAVAARAFLGEIAKFIGFPEFIPKGKAVFGLLDILCKLPGINCFDLLSAITGNNCCLNSTTLDVFLQDEPQSTSTKNIVHLAQMVRTGVLAKYNYGSVAFNLQHYGSASPPIYNLSNIPHDIPLLLSYGGNDALADPVDVGMLLDSLKFHDRDKLQIQLIQQYAHADFIMGINANDLVYNPVVQFFKRQ